MATLRPPGLHLRHARAADVPRLAHLYADVIGALGPEHYPPEAVEAWAAFAGSEGFADFILVPRTLVAVEGDQVVGFGGIEETGRIASLYVDPRWSRRGVASRILEALLKGGRARGLTRFRAEASELSRPLFQRYGFAVVGTEVVEREGVRIERVRMAAG